MKKKSKKVEPITLIDVIDIKEFPDGSAELTFDYYPAFVELYKKTKKTNIVTKKRIGNFLLEILEDAAENDLNLEDIEYK